MGTRPLRPNVQEAEHAVRLGIVLWPQKTHAAQENQAMSFAVPVLASLSVYPFTFVFTVDHHCDASVCASLHKTIRRRCDHIIEWYVVMESRFRM